MMNKLFNRYTPLQLLVHLGAWYPLAHLLFDLLPHNLTANPIQAMQQRTGLAAATLLLLTLTVTPMSSVFGWKEPIRHRRALGLYTFMYACIHVLIFIDLDYGLAWSLIVQTIFQKPYILLGATAFMLLIPLAMTSFDVWKARMGKRWKKLHGLIYWIAPIVLLHFGLSKKGNFLALQGDILKPLIYSLVFLVLLMLRFPPVRRWISFQWNQLRAAWWRRAARAARSKAS
jgi:sulfoxide reductase heme-binding subunit YedZ